MEQNHRTILDLIDKIVSEPKTDGKIPVLPLMCGSGKSTAISQKIREVISSENKEGLLVVTDDVSRMHQYLEPYDKELRKFLKENKDRITILEADTLQDTKGKYPFTPVLLMTTQRYFSLSVEEINSRFLSWKDKETKETYPRTLILFDEKPYLKQIIAVDLFTFTDVYGALKSSQRSLEDNEKHAEDFAVTEWLDRQMAAFNEQCRKNDLEMLIQKKGYAIWQKSMEADDPGLKAFMSLVMEKAKYLSFSRKKNAYDDIRGRAKAIETALTSIGIYEHNGIYQSNLDCVHFLRDNTCLLTDVNAKVLILDGTADIHPDYDEPCFSIRREECAAFERSLSNLTIRIVDVPTNKTALEDNRRKTLIMAGSIRDYLKSEIPEEKEIGVFTYAGDVEKHFIGIYGEKNVEHFGNIKGRNDFRELSYLAQVGVNRFRDSQYYLYRMGKHKELLEVFKIFDCATLTTMVNKSVREKDSPPHKIMIRFMLADLEQNLFRCRIRSGQSTDPVAFYLFLNCKLYADLIEEIKKRYADHFDAKVEIVEIPDALKKAKSLSRKNQEEKAARFWQWHDALKAGEEFTTSQMKEALQLTNKQFDLLKERHGEIQTVLQAERQSQGKYRRG